jgi:hypothetical protein
LWRIPFGRRRRDSYPPHGDDGGDAGGHDTYARSFAGGIGNHLECAEGARHVQYPHHQNEKYRQYQGEFDK